MYLYLFTSTAWKFICTVCSTALSTIFHVFQLRLTKANDHLEIEKRELAVLLEKRNIEIDRLNGNITTKHIHRWLT